MAITKEERFESFKVLLAGSHLEFVRHCGINMKFGASIRSLICHSRTSTHYDYDYVMEIVSNGEHKDVVFNENTYSWYVTAKHSGHFYKSETSICIKGTSKNKVVFTFKSIFNTSIHLLENYIYILLFIDQVKDIHKSERLWSFIADPATISKLSSGEQLDTLIELHKVLRPICSTYLFAQEFFQSPFEMLKSNVKKRIDSLEIGLR